MPAWALAFLNHGATKTIGIILLIGALFGGSWLWHRNGYNIGYREGYEKASALPRNTFTAPATIDQRTTCPEPNIYGLSIGKFGFGIVMKK